MGNGWKWMEMGCIYICYCICLRRIWTSLRHQKIQCQPGWWNPSRGGSIGKQCDRMVWHQEKPHHSATGLHFWHRIAVASRLHRGCMAATRFSAGTLLPQLHRFCCLPVAGTPQGGAGWKGKGPCKFWIICMGVSEHGYLQIIHSNRIFHCEPSISGIHHLWNPPISA